MKIEFKKLDLTMNQVFIMMWIVLVPIIILTMVIGKFMTCVLLGAGVYAYVNKTLNAVKKP